MDDNDEHEHEEEEELPDEAFLVMLAAVEGGDMSDGDSNSNSNSGSGSIQETAVGSSSGAGAVGAVGAAEDADDSWIPCEMCDTLVRFRDYAVHAEECQTTHQAYDLRHRIFIPALEALHQEMMRRHDEDDEQGEDEGDEGDDDGEDEAEGAGGVLGGLGARVYVSVSASPARPLLEVVSPGTADMMRRVAAAMASELQGGGAGAGAGGADQYEMNLLLGEAMGRVERGVQDVDAIVEPFAPSEVTACPVCLERLDVPRADVPVVRTRACGHAFCRPCIGEWLSCHRRCPVCNHEQQ